MLMSWTLPVERMFDEWLPSNGHDRTETLRPAADVYDTGEEYRIVVEMPGVAKDGLEIEVKDDVLRLRGTRPATEETAKLLVSGRRSGGVLERHFTLGKDIDRTKVTARLENGLLTVTLPRRAEEKPHRIEVSVG